MHRKTRETPVGFYVAGVVLLTVTILLAVAVSLVTSPAAAQASTTGYLSPAVTAGHSLTHREG